MKKTNFLKTLIISVISFTILTILIIFLLIINSNNIQSRSFGNKETENSEKLILGFSQIGSESAWRTRNTESIFEAAAENNIQILFDDAQQKQSNQLKAIRSFIVYQVDVIAFVPIVEDGWDNVLQEAKDAGIPVIIVDRQIKSSPELYAGFLGENSLKEGENAGKFLLEKCKNTKKEINIFEFSGTQNSSIVTERAQGFRNIIEKDPKFHILHSEDGDFLRSRGKEIMFNLLAENNGLFYQGKPIDVIYSHNDSMTLGFLDALEQQNIDFSKTIIISIDAEQKSIDALTQGKLSCVVECNPNLGPTLMHLVQEIAAGNTIPRITYMDETIFTEKDDFSTYTPRGY
ncbi:MAG: ABC transporter substrate-binding protein [Treponema sp.]|nr:ABC transporter substrate-binding protein [Treponema sp.]